MRAASRGHGITFEPMTKLPSLLGAAAMAALLAACSGAPGSGSQAPAGGAAASAAPGAKVVNVYNWSDYIAPGVLADFQKETGIKVNYDVFDSNEVLETKVLTGHTNYDVVGPSAAFLERQIKAGVYRKLDKAAIPNLKNIDPQIAQATALYDPGNDYAVDYMWITSGPGYNVDKVRAAMPDAPLDSWRIFYDPAVLAHFKDCGVTVLDAPTEVLGTVLLYLGRDPNSEKAEDLDAAARVLMAIRPYVRYVHSSRYIDDLANGEVCLALGWSGDVKQASDRAREAGKGVQLAYQIPREGAISNYDMLAIPADAPHPQNAAVFINYLLRPEVAARNTNFLKYANPVPGSAEFLNPGVRDDVGVFPPPAVRAKLVPERAHTQPFTRQLTRTWTRFKTGQ